MSAGDKDFYEAQTDHPVSYYINSTGRIKDMIYADQSYIPALVAADGQAIDPLLGPAFCNYLRTNGYDDLVATFTLAYATPALQQHTLGLLCSVTNGDSTLWLIHKRYTDELAAMNQQNSSDSTGGTDSTGYSDSLSYTDSVINCDTVLAQVIGDNIEVSDLAARSIKYAIETGAFDQWMRLVSVDSLLYNDDGHGSTDTSSGTLTQALGGQPPLRGGAGMAMVTLATGSIADYEDGYGKFLMFLDGWDGSNALLNQVFSPDDLLRTVYNNDPPAYVNAFNTAFGDDAVDSIVVALPRLSYTSHITTAAVDIGIGLPPTLALTAVVKDKQFDLAAHDMYGSSRLGIKSYYPRQVGLSYTQADGFSDTVRLWTKRPWYSLEYQDIINQDSLNLYGNAHKDMYYTQQTRGLKQYELTDHLGDVLVTLSDKRAMNGYQPLSAVDSILNYKPIALSAYDYYPFGQYMPGRYTEDTNSYCFTTTLTEMVTVVTQVPLELHEAHRMAGSGGSSTDAGIDIKPNDDGSTVIYMHRTNAGTGAGVGVPIGGLGNGGSPSDPGDPVHPGGGTSPIEGDVQITATVSGTGVFNVSVTDDSTGKNLGNVLISSSNNIGTIKLHYSGENGHTTSLHVTLDHAMDDNNVITFSVVTVPHYTYVPVSVVSRVCNGESYMYGYNGQMKVNEIAGLGNHNTALYWEYDTRLGRRWNLDPKPSSWESRYATFANNPILHKDPLGDTILVGGFGQFEEGPNTWEKALLNFTVKNKKVDDGVFVYSAHGAADKMMMRDALVTTKDIKRFSKYMADHSPEWAKAMNSGKKITIVLYSCSTGGPNYNEIAKKYSSNIAQTLSAAYPNLTVIAPDGELDVISNKAQTRVYGINIVPNKYIPKDAKKQNSLKWVIYQKGKAVKSSENNRKF